MSARSDAKASRRRRRPVARHGQLRSPNPLTQILAVLGVMVAVVVVSGVAVGGFYVWNATQVVADAGVSIGDDDSQLPRRSARSRAA